MLASQKSTAGTRSRVAVSPEFSSVPVDRQAVQPHIFLLDVLITGLRRERQGWGLMVDLLQTVHMVLGSESHCTASLCRHRPS